MNISENISDTFSNFSSNSFVSGSKDFLESNSLVAKFAFLILALILFVIGMSAGSALLTKLFAFDKSPKIINGMIDSRQMMVIPQDPSKKGAVPIFRSENEREGLEFTWSVWILVNDFSYKEHEYKHVFHKGNDNIQANGTDKGINFPNNAPGLYIMPDINALKIIMNTFAEINEEIIVDNLPLHKWVNVIIRVTKQNQLDVYINGTLTKRHMLGSIPKQNYGSIYVSMNGGFSGNTSDLRYFNEAIGTNKIQELLTSGPGTKTIFPDINGDLSKKDANKYLSLRWFMNHVTDS
jgi:hypothetical protein